MLTKYDIAANVTLAELDGFQGRLTAKVQKEIFGRNIFGKKKIKIDASNQGTVSGTYSCCFGTDSAWFEKSFEQIANLANNPEHPVHF